MNPSRLFAKFNNFWRFAGRIVALAAPYFRSEEKWKARLLLVAIVLLNLGTVYMAVQFNDWYRVFYDALEKRDQVVFWQQMGRFSYLAFGAIIIAVYKFYLTQLLQMRWRAWMTRDYLRRWLSHHAFYKMELARYSAATDINASPDNPDQRIQEDVQSFTTSTISLSMGVLNAVVTLVSFVGLLWVQSGPLAFNLGGSTYTIPGYMVWVAVAYCLVGSVLAHYIGRPLIKLNFMQQRYEANFRHHMVRVREYSESIALDHGESVERNQLDGRFTTVLANYLNLIRANKKLIWFQSFFGQAALIFPFLVAAPRFFSGAIQLGQLLQISQTFGKVQDSLSWFVDNYDNLASWRATTDRLTSFEDSMSTQEKDNTSLATSEAASLTTGDLQLALPTGAVLLKGLELHAGAGDFILLKGPSGSGKSTLFRALAGIWPFASGRVARPANAMFIPQRPYFPNGSLRDALAYPEPAANYSDDTLKQALHDALLPGLASRLDEEDAWAQKLSGGEQQRLSIARVLLKKPQWIFADEATSALDEAAEKTLYERLQALVKTSQGAMLSIAHRPTVTAFHQKLWEFEKQPEGSPALYRLQERPAQEAR
ncbi:putative ATP-binding cassette transporter [Polaromonas sp. YR568]|uniref:ABC transporter ATP-binding protein/permease n=1 Tax=Polaromonas sp. YR568 TaxID=1855301 RepID=UPI0008E35E38|nr:ABC transporter ATP-binding protein/permease [Polaromonas sp. YR568]SFU65745.1 putative ATP-binding cassette transporter [Polaromonas sp. YR568]